jgi:hypothetical protein
VLLAVVSRWRCVTAEVFATHRGFTIDRITLIFISTGTRTELFVVNWRLSVACVTGIPITTGTRRRRLTVRVVSILLVAFMVRWTLIVISAVILWRPRSLPPRLGVTTIEDH